MASTHSPHQDGRQISRLGKLSVAHLSLYLLVILTAALVVITYLAFGHLNHLEQRVDSTGTHLNQLQKRIEELGRESETALRQATQAESYAREAAAGRVRAEAARAEAEDQASAARNEAENARREIERLEREREAELNRLQETLSRIVETRRTALGVVMNLGSDSMQFDFDRATLRPENRELLSRVSGVLLTMQGYGIYVYGHTDDIGTEEYNQRLSEERAAAVRDYLVESGIDSGIITTKGFGKSRPLVAGVDSASRARNRRVEIGVVNTRLKYEKTLSQPMNPQH